MSFLHPAALRSRSQSIATARGRRVARPWVVLGLVLLLLSTQGLGLWHRLAHAGAVGLQQAQPALQAVATAADHERFSHTAGLAECHLFDELLLQGGLCKAVPALLTEPLSHAQPPAAALSSLAQAPRLAYLARAPPLRG